MANSHRLTERSILEKMKIEVAQELGIQLGPETVSRENGYVGGEMTKRLVAFAESQLQGRTIR